MLTGLLGLMKADEANTPLELDIMVANEGMDDIGTVPVPMVDGLEADTLATTLEGCRVLPTMGKLDVLDDAGVEATVEIPGPTNSEVEVKTAEGEASPLLLGWPLVLIPFVGNAAVVLLGGAPG